MTTILENFEDGALTPAGVSMSGQSLVILAPSAVTDSVDGDDGSIDGSGTGGRSVHSVTSVTFMFDSMTLGGLPNHAGIVWTDGQGNATFQAFGPGGASLGTIGPTALGDGTSTGGTAEDRFFGVQGVAGGIESIRISMDNEVGIEVDHLQFGLTPPMTPTATNTATVTPTITSTPTITNTPTRTLTPTATATATVTSTRTATSTATSTLTPTSTGTPTSTATVTSTRTATSTPTVTSTPTITRTPTQTRTPDLSAPGAPAIPTLGGGAMLGLVALLALLAIRRLRAT